MKKWIKYATALTTAIAALVIIPASVVSCSSSNPQDPYAPNTATTTMIANSTVMKQMHASSLATLAKNQTAYENWVGVFNNQISTKTGLKNVINKSIQAWINYMGVCIGNRLDIDEAHSAIPINPKTVYYTYNISDYSLTFNKNETFDFNYTLNYSWDGISKTNNWTEITGVVAQTYLDAKIAPILVTPSDYGDNSQTSFTFNQPYAYGGFYITSANVKFNSNTTLQVPPLNPFKFSSGFNTDHDYKEFSSSWNNNIQKDASLQIQPIQFLWSEFKYPLNTTSNTKKWPSQLNAVILDAASSLKYINTNNNSTNS